MAKQLINKVIERAEKLQGTTARLTARLPAFSQRALARVLGFDSQHPNLDAHLQMLLAVRGLINNADLIGNNPEKSRRHFRKEMASIVGTPTPVSSTKDFTIPSRSGELTVRHYIPAGNNGAQPLPLLVFFHGGGFVVGDIDTHDEPCRLFCKESNVHVLSIDYRLAPEHPAPAAIEDCVDALKWAYEHAKELGVDASKIAVGGDSAGGNISTVVNQETVGKPYAPAAQLLIYPVVDLLHHYPTHDTYGSGLFLSRTDMDNAKESYLRNSKYSLKDALVTPMAGNLAGLAPALLVTAELDTLRDEGEMYAVRLNEVGSHCVAYRVEGQGHGFINMTTINKAAYKATVKMAKDFRALLDGKI